MPTITEEEREQKAIAVAEMLHFIVEGILDGTWREYKFNVRQHRKEVHRYGRVVRVQPSKVEITFSMDVDEEKFKADITKRKKEVNTALEHVHDVIDARLIDHDGTKQ